MPYDRLQLMINEIDGGIPLENYVSILGVSKKYQTKNGEVAALENVVLQVAEGEFVSIVGQSGCGKSISNICGI